MKIKIKIMILILFVCNIAFGQQCNECKTQFDILLVGLKKEKISNSELSKYAEIVKILWKEKYYDYVDSVANYTMYTSHSLTEVYADLCIKCGGEFGVKSYVEYIDLTIGSAEEERAFSFERLFVKYPLITLKLIKGDQSSLDNLVWGFVNNRYFENTTLTKTNCKELFFKTNPRLKDNYSKYSKEIDYIISEVIKKLD